MGDEKWGERDWAGSLDGEHRIADDDEDEDDDDDGTHEGEKNERRGAFRARGGCMHA
jgi:hypothetical protein